MLAFLIALQQFWGAIRMAWREPAFKSIAAIMAVLLVLGTLFYSRVEGWSLLDSFYFSVITLATVGYGDFAPRTPFGKLFTVLYIFLGFGLLVALLTRFAEGLIQSERENRERRRQRRARARAKEAPHVEGITEGERQP